ncbi:hypothetical protein HZC30_00745 [Candidatus Woesearchaeota archaeon]|nr:hypothetical protein [Candidatus Woesearchaeota archaeon]
MIKDISSAIKEKLLSFPLEDKLIFNNKLIQIDKTNFTSIPTLTQPKTIAFIDGGQAELISAGNFCLSFIRVFTQVFQNNTKKESFKHEFYLLTTAVWKKEGLENSLKEELFYESKIFPVQGEKLIDEEELFISSNDATIKSGVERAAISKVTNIARRFSELSLAVKLQEKVDFVVLDGNLDATYKNENKFISRLNENVSALAKTSSLFTISGNSPVVLLNKINPPGCWSYFVDGKTYFVKLHQRAKHVFRFDGNKEVLSILAANSHDAIFLGYPYGLIHTDKFARVSNEERNALRMQFLLRKENKEILEYLSTSDAHEVLDNLS